MLPPNQEVLFTRQVHEAKRAGKHYDIRFVVGDKAYSFATKKDLPEVGSSILLYEQPVHDAAYALSKRVEIPDGQYGAGVTTLDFVRKAKIGEHSTPEQMTIHSKGERFLLKKMNEHYGNKAWLFKNLGTGNQYLEKIAENLQPHQQDALDILEREGGVLVHHSTGSGKTKTFLTAVSRAQEKDKTGKALIIAPASLVSNVEKEVKKHGIKLDRDRLEVLSYEKATRDSDRLAKNKYSIVAMDEGHKLRNIGTKRTQALNEIASSADRRLIATATANYNHLADISPLLNIAAGGRVLPTDRKEMENRYVRKIIEHPGFIDRIKGAKPTERQIIKNPKDLKKVFDKYVSYYDSKADPESAKKFPKVTEETVEVPMDKKQVQMYKYVEGSLPFMLRMKIRHNLPLDKKEKASLNSFSTGVRQASNTTRHLSQDHNSADYSPKIKSAVNRLKHAMNSDKNFRGVVYSNYLEAGVDEYSKKLLEHGIKHNKYTGAIKKEDKDQMVKDYNSGKTPVLLISSSGGEGLDLKGTKLTQILEPHFNKAKIQQVMGRGARYESHTHLPEKERNMKVEHYLSVYEKPFIGKAPFSIDKYLSENSEDKNEVFDQVKELMKAPELHEKLKNV